MKKPRYYLVLIIYLMMYSCFNLEMDPLTNTFAEHELVEIDKIVEFYDNHVIENTSSIIPIAEAYRQFIEQNRPNDSIPRDINIFYIDSEERNNFLNTIDPEFIKEIYVLSDSVRFFDPRIRENFVVYPPYSTDVYRFGKFQTMLELMAKNNHFYGGINDDLLQCGDFSPTTYARLIHYCDSIDFNQKSERFVFAVSFLNLETDLKRYINNAPQ